MHDSIQYIYLSIFLLYLLLTTKNEHSFISVIVSLGTSNAIYRPPTETTFNNFANNVLPIYLYILIMVLYLFTKYIFLQILGPSALLICTVGANVIM